MTALLENSLDSWVMLNDRVAKYNPNSTEPLIAIILLNSNSIRSLTWLANVENKSKDSENTCAIIHQNLKFPNSQFPNSQFHNP
jgi:hypothetical protein